VENLNSDKDKIVSLANEESNLPVARCEGEFKRTTGQLQLFANLIHEGKWFDARIDGPIRSMLVPIGPVAIFGASNFPLAFSTLGGDTASALAAGCTVIYKTHPGHPQTTHRCNDAIQKAIKDLKFPDGVFQITPPGPNALSTELVMHPLIEGLGFTGSRHVGSLLSKAAANRPKPIPAYCEMGSVNPFFVFPNSLGSQSEEIAKGLANSVTLGVGQFCTNPGLVFLIGKKPDIDTFVSSLVKSIAAVPPGPMLTPDILKAYKSGVDELAKVKGVKQLHYTSSDKAGASVFTVSLSDFTGHAERLQQEVFGPSTLIVTVDNIKEEAQLQQLPSVLEGQLTATFHGTPIDLQNPNYTNLITQVGERVGRLVWCGYPTGVEVNTSIQHGGPWPASSDGGRTTSVGTRAILRWVRPLAYQNFPEQLLPSPLKTK